MQLAYFDAIGVARHPMARIRASLSPAHGPERPLSLEDAKWLLERHDRLEAMLTKAEVKAQAWSDFVDAMRAELLP